MRGEGGGRPTILDTLQLTPEDIHEVYVREGTVRKAAAALKISVVTLRKYLGDNVYAKGRKLNPYPWKRQISHPVQEWLDAHQGAVPRSVRAIALACGQSYSATERYLYRRRDATKAYLESLGDLRDLERVVLHDTRGRTVLAGMIMDYLLKVDKYNLVVSINATLRFGGVIEAKLSFSRYKELFGGQQQPTS